MKKVKRSEMRKPKRTDWRKRMTRGSSRNCWDSWKSSMDSWRNSNF